jgi:hypothetical protein
MELTSEEEGVMPRETISGRYFGKPIKVVDGDNEVLEPPDNAVVMVGWTNHQEAAQIGIVRPTPGDEAKQIWLDLDRVGINKLILALRKARDKSFGKDA